MFALGTCSRLGCGALAPHSCSACGAPYCGPVCQKLDWPLHKAPCKVVKAAEQAARAAVTARQMEADAALASHRKTRRMPVITMASAQESLRVTLAEFSRAWLVRETTPAMLRISTREEEKKRTEGQGALFYERLGGSFGTCGNAACHMPVNSLENVGGACKFCLKAFCCSCAPNHVSTPCSSCHSQACEACMYRRHMTCCARCLKVLCATCISECGLLEPCCECGLLVCLPACGASMGPYPCKCGGIAPSQ